MDLAKAQLNVPASATQGTPTKVQGLMDKWVQVTGIAGGGQLRLQGTIDGTYVNLGAVISADGIVEVAEAVEFMRVDRTIVGSGTPTVTVVGRP